MNDCLEERLYRIANNLDDSTNKTLTDVYNLHLRQRTTLQKTNKNQIHSQTIKSDSFYSEINDISKTKSTTESSFRLNIYNFITSASKFFLDVLEYSKLFIEKCILVLLKALAPVASIEVNQSIACKGVQEGKIKESCKKAKMNLNESEIEKGKANNIKETISKLQKFLSNETLIEMWKDIDTSDTLIRGINYMNDKNKVKACASMGKLIHLDMLTFSSEERVDHIAQWELQRENSLLKYFNQHHPDVLIFIVNLQVPRTPRESVVCYWAIPLNSTLEEDKPFYHLLNAFINKDDEYRNARLKLLPKLVEGPLLVKGAVIQRPAITGKKFTHRYFKEKNYFEVDMDLGSSVIATQIVSLCAGYCTKIVVDISFILQGETLEELPERILGSVRFNRLNLTQATRI